MAYLPFVDVIDNPSTVYTSDGNFTDDNEFICPRL